MTYILLDQKKNLIATSRDTICTGEDLSVKLIFLVPTTLSGNDMSNSSITMLYTDPVGNSGTIALSKSQTMYNDSYYQYVIPLSCDLTEYPGLIRIWLEISSGDASCMITTKTRCVSLKIDKKHTGAHHGGSDICGGACPFYSMTINGSQIRTQNDSESLNIVCSKTVAEWNQLPDFVGHKNTIYIYSDACTEGHDAEDITYIPYMKIGDGRTPISDLPYLGAVCHLDGCEHSTVIALQEMIAELLERVEAIERNSGVLHQNNFLDSALLDFSLVLG